MGAPSWRGTRWFAAADSTAGTLALAASTARALLTLPLTWRLDFVEQCAIIVRRVAWPLALSCAAFAYAVLVINVGSISRTLGSADRLGAITALASLREVAAWVTGMLVAGIAGTAICSDLGSRKVREELDALSVLAVDVNKALVLPRVLAITVMSPLMYLWAVLWCSFTVLALGPAKVGFTFASFVETYQTFPLVDLYAGVVKMTLIGAIVGVVVCFKGMNASGGPEGVGRSVNQAVVTAFVATWIVSTLFNTFFQGAFPEAQNLR